MTSLIKELRNERYQSCLDLVSHMQKFIPTTMNQRHFQSEQPIELDYNRRAKNFYTKCPEFEQYRQELTRDTSGDVNMEVFPFNGYVSHVSRHVDIDADTGKVNYRLVSGWKRDYCRIILNK